MQRLPHAAASQMVAVQQAQPQDVHHVRSALTPTKRSGTAQRAHTPSHAHTPSRGRAIAAWDNTHTPPPNQRQVGLSAGTPASGSGRARAVVVPEALVHQSLQREVAKGIKHGDQPCRPPNGMQHSIPHVAVIAPGAGTRANGAVYADLGQDGGVCLEIVGQSGRLYDRYPATWPQGAPAPNLESFAKEVLSRGTAEQSDCLVLGSRGGQVVLPCLWRAKGPAIPPAIVINGGCAMSLPTDVHWPETAVTFLLLGGRDNFRGSLSPREYVEDARSRVPRDNRTTALLYVHEMAHMPQVALLGAALRPMLAALLAWRTSVRAPTAEFERLVMALARGGWNGQLWYTVERGVWQDVPFGMGKASTDSVRLAGSRSAVARGGA